MCRVPPQSPVHISADEVSAQSTPSADGAVRSRSFILSKYVLASADNLICTQYQVFHNSYKPVQIGSISYSMLFFEFEFFADGPFTFRLVWTGLDLLKKEIKNLTAATSS